MKTKQGVSETDIMIYPTLTRRGDRADPAIQQNRRQTPTARNYMTVILHNSQSILPSVVIFRNARPSETTTLASCLLTSSILLPL